MRIRSKMISDNDNRYRLTASRRAFLKSSAGMAGLSFIPTGVNATNRPNNREIITIAKRRRGKRVAVKTKKVPRAWITHIKLAKKVNRHVAQKYLDKPGIIGVGSARSDKKIGDKHKLEVDVKVDESKLGPNNSFDPIPDLPDQVSGITVRPSEAKEVRNMCYNDEWFDPIPGAAKLWNDSAEYGTASWRVRINGEMHMATTYHLVSDSNNVYQPLTRKMGTVGASEGNWDIAFISEGDGIQYSDKIEGENKTYDINSFYTESGVCDLASQWFDGHSKMGVSSGITTGGVKECHYTYSGNTTLDGHGVLSGANIMAGDSGAPAFGIENSDQAILIASLSKGLGSIGDTTNDCGYSYPTSEDSAGIAAYHLDNNGYYQA